MWISPKCLWISSEFSDVICILSNYVGDPALMYCRRRRLVEVGRARYEKLQVDFSLSARDGRNYVIDVLRQRYVVTMLMNSRCSLLVKLGDVWG